MGLNSFDDFINNVDYFEKEYKGILCSFFNEKEKNLRIRKMKDKIYSIKCKKRFEYKKDIIWRYLNGELELEDTLFILRRKF